MDEQGRRPGGLTALAVINFVLVAFGVLGAMFWAALLTNEQARTEFEAKAEVTVEDDALVVQLVVTAVMTALLLASGIGYLKQRRFLGRTIGNVYSILSIVGGVLTVAFVGFHFGAIVNLVYPVLTFVLINTTFKDDLVH
jgi:heme/copper-type cytochrome/quinol oxidase subunit 3